MNRWVCIFLLPAVMLCTGSSLIAQSPAKTTITDIVYRANGDPASGTILITWPDFNTADNKTVAGGTLSVAIGAGGAVNLALVPNQGASPAGTYYKVVYQLDDGANSTEYWVVPSASPTTITAIRSQIVPANVAAQLASRSYVDAQLINKADLSSVVMKTGSTMTGPLLLAGPPTVQNQAVTKSYVDAQSGAVPGQTLVDSSTYTTIQAAINAAGANGSVLIPSGYAGTDTYTNPNNITIVDLRKGPNRWKPFINVVTDCGVKGDGVTDDGAAIQACINANPGHNIFFPMTQPAGSCSYYSTQTIYPKGDGMILLGESSGFKNSYTAAGGTTICFAAGVTGVWLDVTNGSATVRDLSLQGSEGTNHLVTPTLFKLPSGLPQASRSISSIQRTSNVLTVVTSQVNSTEGLTQSVGSTVNISGVTGDATMNGLCTILTLTGQNAYGENPTGFTCSQNGADSGPFGAVGIVSPPTTGPADDGIRVCGNFDLIDHVEIHNFGRHGINADSSPGNGCANAFSDDLVVRNSILLGNGGNGFLCRGGADCNAGWMSGNALYYNALWGVEDQSPLGNTWVGNQASYNGSSQYNSSTPATKNISSISRTGGVVSVTLASADTSIGVGSAVVIAGVTDSSFNTPAGGAYFVTVSTDSTHYQYIQPGAPANASSSGGTSRVAKMSEAILASGLDTGSYKIATQAPSWSTAWVSNYSEGGQNCKFYPALITFAGANGGSVCAGQITFTPTYFQKISGNNNIGTNMTTFANEVNATRQLFFKAGKSTGTAQDFYFRWLDNNGNDTWFVDAVNSGGANAPTGSWSLYRGVFGNRRLAFFGPSSASGITRMNSESTGAVEINNDSNSGTGGLKVCSGGASPTCPSSPVIDSGNIHFAAAFKSANSNAASAGQIRFANSDAFKIRNSLNTADLTAVSADSTGVVLGDTTGGASMYGQLTLSNASLNVTGTGIVSTPSLNLAGDSATAQARIAWGSFLSGALTSTWTAAQFTPKKAVTVVQVEARAKTGPTSCTTYPVIQITDGTTAVNTTFNAANVTNNISGGQNYAANAVLQVKVSTAAAGCTTNPADVNVTVQYKMQ